MRQQFRKRIFFEFEDGFTESETVCIPDSILEDGEWAIREWNDHKGLRGCGFFHVIDGKIIFQRGYEQKLSFLRLHAA